MRVGNKNVLPLLPDGLEGVAEADLDLLREIIQKTSLTLAQSIQQNADIKSLGYALVCNKELEVVRDAEEMVMSPARKLRLEKEQAIKQAQRIKFLNVQNRRLVKDAARKSESVHEGKVRRKPVTSPPV